MIEAMKTEDWPVTFWLARYIQHTYLCRQFAAGRQKDRYLFYFLSSC
jgi:hypothetical protein